MNDGDQDDDDPVSLSFVGRDCSDRESFSRHGADRERDRGELHGALQPPFNRGKGEHATVRSSGTGTSNKSSSCSETSTDSNQGQNFQRRLRQKNQQKHQRHQHNVSKSLSLVKDRDRPLNFDDVVKKSDGWTNSNVHSNGSNNNNNTSFKPSEEPLTLLDIHIE